MASPRNYSFKRKKMSFTPLVNEVFYYNPQNDSRVDGLISSHYDEITELFESKQKHFIFLPEFNKTFDIKDHFDQMEYFNPRFEKSKIVSNGSITYNDLKTFMSIPDDVTSPCLVRCMEYDNDDSVFSIFFIDYTDHDTLIKGFKEDYLNHLYSGPYYHLVSEEQLKQILKGKLADERFDDDVYLIGKEILERVNKLKAKGITSMAIHKLIDDESDKPSRLFIDKHHRIFLTDYGNREIKLSPLHKAVFFLFLQHPAGIYFKHLPLYHLELREIYSRLSGRESKEDIEKSISRLTNPLDNSINEKCARIKNAFVSEFQQEVAKWYYIDGKCGEKKKILLPRELVTWEKED